MLNWRYFLAVGIIICALIGIFVSRGREEREFTAEERELTAYIPCGMIEPFEAVFQAFEKETGVKAEPYYENTGILVRQISEGERPDIFVSPGAVEMRVLQEKGLIEPKSRAIIGSYTIVLVVPKENPADIESLQDLLKDKVKDIAMGEADSNSVGYYTRQSLRKLGLWEKIKSKISETEHPFDSYKFVSRKQAQAAFSFRACPLESNPEKMSYAKVKIVEELPPDTYDPPTVLVAILKEARHKETAQKFINFLIADSTQKLLAKNGLPNERNVPYKILSEWEPTGERVAISKQPKVVIQAFYPHNEGHREILELVRSFERKYPGKVRAETYDITGRKREDFEKWRATGLTCGGILINGEWAWEVTVKGETYEVALLHGIDVDWTAEELEAAVAKAVEEAYSSGERKGE